MSIWLLIFSVRLAAGGDAAKKTRNNKNYIAITQRAAVRKLSTLEQEAAILQR